MRWHFSGQRWKWSGGCVKLKDRLSSKGMRERLGQDDTILVLQQNRLGWYGHVLQKEDNDWVKKCMKWRVLGQEIDQRKLVTEIAQKD